MPTNQSFSDDESMPQNSGHENSGPENESVFDEVVSVAVAEPETREERATGKKTDKKPKKQPPYHVILWDDTDHSYEYVVMMMKRLFRMPIERGFQVAKEVDKSGRAICMTTTMELAELKRDQIHAFGKDELLPRCKGSMSATIEPAEG